MDKVRVLDEDPMDSGSGSHVSDLDVLNDNETDTLGRRILQEQLERQQREKKENRRPFFRAQGRRARTQIAIDSGLGTAPPLHQRTVSEGSNIVQNPPLNVPREWGRRGRRRGDWRRNFGSDEEPKDAGAAGVKVDEDSIFPHRTLYTGDEHPLLSPSGVMAAVENTPPSMRRQRQSSSPSSMHHMNTTLLQSKDAEDIEFNDASLLVSTPAVNQRNRKIDHLMKEEIAIVKKQQVTSRTLTQIHDRPGSAPGSDQKPKRRSRRMSDKESQPDIMGHHNARDPAVAFDPEPSKKKSVHSRNDSIALLRKLARVSSLSPSPSRDGDPVRARRKSDDDVSAVPLDLHSGNEQRTTKKSSTARERIEARRVRINDEKARKEEAVHVEPTPVTQTRDPTSKTPVTVGAWVDTPGRPAEQPTPNAVAEPIRPHAGAPSKRHPRRMLSEPAHPKSALEAVVQDAKENRDPLLGESTIASLEDIVHPNLDPTNSTITQDVGEKSSAEPAKDQMEDGLTQAEKDRREEDIALANLNKRLQSTRSNIKDANRGLRRIENRIEAATETEPERITEYIVQEESSEIKWPRHLRPYTHHNNRTICEHCGGSYTSVWVGLWTEFRENFWTYDGGSNQDRFRLTWFGWTVLLWCSWYNLESSLQSAYGYRYNAYFPFVIPTLFFRLIGLGSVWTWIGASCTTSLKFLFGTEPQPRPIARIQTPLPNINVADTLAAGIGEGEWYGTVAQATATSTAVTRAVNSAGGALDQAGSMWDDEVL
jgi:hypothetical protein